MIRTVIGLLPSDESGRITRYSLLAIVSVVLRAVTCLLLIPLITSLFGADPATAWPWLGWLTLATVSAWVVDTVLARLGVDLGFALLNSTQHRMADRLTRVPLGWFTADRTVTARQAISSGGPELVGLFTNLLTPLTGAVLLPIALAAGLFVVAWPVGLAAALAVPVLLGALWASTRIVRAADAADGRANGVLTERILEFARTQQVLRASRRADAARSEAGRASAARYGTTLRLLLFQIPGQVLFSVANQVALLLLAGTIAVLTVRGIFSPPEAVALVLVAVRFLEPFNALTEIAPGIENARGTLERLRNVTSAPLARITDAEEGPEVSRPPRIECRDVWFRYSGADSDAVAGLTFAIEAGNTTAVVGPSGSGKSTVLALIAGLHTPDRGQILINGQDVTELDPTTRAGWVSVVFQQPYLFDGSIEDNIRVGDPEASAEGVQAVSTLARVDVIADRERAVVGEGGRGLSGGERQRVSIARALIKPAPILLIDEATSALDSENDVAIIQALGNDARERTRVIVAHRRSSISRADQVIFIEDGAVAEQGSIADLTAQGGRFAEFWRQQEQSSHWRITA